MPQVDETETFFRVRIRSPARMKQCRTPRWATTAANSISRGAKVVTCQDAKGKWKIQSVMIVKGHGKTKATARKLANRVVRKIEK